MKTKLIVFSRDRAMQLDATLHSFFLRCQDAASADVVVLYKTTSLVHETQYLQLKADYVDRVRFISETTFRQQVLDELISALPAGSWRNFYSLFLRLGSSLARLLPLALVGAQSRGHVLFLVDDSIFIRKFSISDIAHSMESCPTALGFSLRLGENTTYCYALDMAQQTPAFKQVQNGICIYSWPGASADFGYPLELSSSVYRIGEILHLLLAIPFRNPNTLEGEMAARARSFASSHPDLLCFRKSVAFCVPVNRVQDIMKNRAGQDTQLSSENLAELFRQGQRIDVEALLSFTPNACHQEIAFTFAQPDSFSIR